MKPTSYSADVVSRYQEYLRYEQDSDVGEYLSYLRWVARGNVLEIGVRWGLSTTCLLRGVIDNKGHVYSVDINDYGSVPVHPQWTFIKANSVTEANYIKYQIPETLDVLYIDGDHSYESVKSDLETFGALVRPGGIILAHDVNPEGITPDLLEKGWVPSPGSRKAFDEYVAEHSEYRSEILDGRAGLGVIYK